MSAASDELFGGPIAPEEQKIADELLSTYSGWDADWESQHAQVPECLYHYTNATGLLGIVQSSTLWASNAAFLNDSTELTYVDHILASVTAELEAKYNLPEVSEVLGLVSGIVSGAARRVSDVFVSCLCENPDLLSQWRGYPPAGGGYAVGFRPARLPSRPPLLRKVIYNESKQTAILRTLFEPSCAALFGATDRRRMQSAFLKFVLPGLGASLGELGYSFKHPGFEEESEWRLVTLHHRPALPHESVKARASGPQLIPYIETPIEVSGEGAIAEVVVGPSGHPELAMRAVQDCLASAGCNASKMVRHSTVPLRV